MESCIRRLLAHEWWYCGSYLDVFSCVLWYVLRHAIFGGDRLNSADSGWSVSLGKRQTGILRSRWLLLIKLGIRALPKKLSEKYFVRSRMV